MRKKMYIVLVLVFFIIVSIVLWDSFLWRLFGFKYCENPECSLVNIEVEDNCCYVLFMSEYGGSSSSATYNDIVYEFADGVLKIGAHKSFALNASTEISEDITVNGTITEVRICGGGSEKIIWQSVNQGTVKEENK